MTKLICLLVGLITFNFSYSQSRVIDSLEVLLNKHSVEDSIRLNVLIALSGQLDVSSPKRGIEIAEEAVTLAGKLQLNSKLASAFMHKGNNYWVLGELSEAAICYQKALEVYQLDKNLSGEGKALNNLGLLSYNFGEYQEAINYHQKAAGIFEELGSMKLAATANSNKGVVLQYLADYTGAHKMYMQALSVFINEKDTINHTIAHIYNNLGIVNKNLGNYDFALEYYQKALPVYEKLNNLKGKADLLSNIGVLYNEAADYAKGAEYFMQSQEIAQQIEYKKLQANNYTNIGISQFNLNRFDASIKNFKEAKAICEELNDKNSLSIVLNQMAKLFLAAPDTSLQKFGINPKGKSRLALAYQLQGLKIATEIGATDRLSELYEGISNTYSILGDHRNAYEAYIKYSALKDSIINRLNANDITRKQVQFEFDRKEVERKAELDKQQALAEAEIKYQRAGKYIAIGGAFLLLLTGVVIWANYKRRRDAEEKKTIAEFNMLVAETEMNALRSKLNPHFIFNSLNSIANYIDNGQHETASDFIVKFSKLIRQTLENSFQKEISLKEDINMLELYLQLEKHRLNDKFNYSIHIHSDIDADKLLVPPMLIQPFVENSIWHGFSKKDAPCKISLHIFKKEGMLYCLLEDNGIGRIPQSSNEKPNKSFGIAITQSRLSILNKTGNHQAGISFKDLEEGLQVELKLPIIEDE